MDTIKTEDGLVLCDGKEVKDRWNQYCSNLYKKNKDLTTTLIRLNDNEDEPPPLLDEVIKAIKEVKNNKSPGIDEITAELIKNAGESVEYFFYKLCTKIWNERKWPEDWVKSVFTPIPKKGDALQCNNNRTIALISHSSKILLKIIAERMKLKLREEIADEQAGFRPGKGTRNQILNLKLIIEKNREHQKDLYLCFIDYVKAFDTVDHDILWNNMNDMKFPKHIIQLIKAMYDQQQAAVRTTYGLTEWFEVKQGVRQGCILSPHLFNIYSETIMRGALENFEGTVDVGGYKISNLRYADDIVLIASSITELQQLLDKVREASEKAGLFLNAKKTKIMKIQR
ncbi:reverse transcriptase family protein [Pseudomonas aeruginosa]|nr:reverse transcriptase family protein [Pseudomonas aeruginosa]